MAVLEAAARAKTGKYAAFDLRRAAKVPAVIYGKGVENQTIALGQKELQLLLEQGKRLIDLRLAGQEIKTVLKDAQFANIGGKVIHADFRVIDENTVLHLEVPLSFTGTAAGEEFGGVVSHDMHSIMVACKASDLPRAIEVDVSALNIGSVFYVRDLPVLSGVKYDAGENLAVASCHGKAVEEDNAATAEEEEAATAEAAAAEPAAEK